MNKLELDELEFYHSIWFTVLVIILLGVFIFPNQEFESLDLKIIKDNPERVKTIIFVSLHISSVLGIVSEPFLPFTSKKIKSILQSDNHEMKWSWDNLKNNDFLISENLKINEPELLFSRIEDSEIQKQIDKLNKNN